MKKNNHRLILLTAGLQFLAFGVFGQTILFTPTDSAGAVPQSKDSTIIKSINIKINNDFLIDPLKKEFQITLPEPGMNPGRMVTIVNTERQSDPKLNSYTWYGKLENEAGSFVLLTQVKNAVSGYIRTERNMLYRINYIGNKLHRISKINQGFYKPDKSDVPSAALLNNNTKAIAKSGQICNDAAGGVIDVLACYTEAAKNRALGVSAVEAEILGAVNLTNQSYSNSQINHRLRLTRMTEVVYTESGGGETDRNRLQDTNDGYLDAVHNLRDRELADIVVLFVADPGPYSGVAYIMETPSPAFESWAFCVVKLDDASLNHAFAHEIGHLMGAEHDCEFDDGSPISFPYSHGYRHGAFKTIMSVNALGTKVEYWANSTVPFPGTSILTGGARGSCQANDYQTIANGFEIVSKFRCRSPVPEPDPPVTDPTASNRQFDPATIETEPSTIESFLRSTESHTSTSETNPSCSLWSPCFWIAVSISLIIVSLLIWFFWKRRKRDR